MSKRPNISNAVLVVFYLSMSLVLALSELTVAHWDGREFSVWKWLGLIVMWRVAVAFEKWKDKENHESNCDT